MAISESITRTLVRLGGVAKSLLGGPQLRKLYEGLSGEPLRIEEYRDTVLAAAVPSSALPVEALDDLEVKYGLTYLQDLSDDARIARLIERASVDGSGGPAWLQATIQAAGFPLYVIENGLTADLTISNPIARYSFDKVPEIPDDPAGTYYRNVANWANGVDGWRSNTGGALLAIANNSLHVAAENQFALRDGDFNGKYIFVRTTSVNAASFGIGYRTPGGVYHLSYKSIPLEAGQTAIVSVFIPEATDILYLGNGTNEFYINDVYIGTGAYLPNSVLDNSGNGNNSQEVTGVTPTEGISGNGLQGSASAKVTLPMTWSNKMTRTFWIKPDAGIVNRVVFSSCTYWRTNGDRMWADDATGSLFAYSVSDQAGHYTQVNFSLSLGAWHFVSIVYNGYGSTAQVYADNVLVATLDLSALTSDPSPTSEYWFYGNVALLPNYTGEIDEITRYSRALSADERAFLFANPGLVPTRGITQYGASTEYGSATQYWKSARRVDPRTVPGVLITSSPNRRSGPRIAGSSQYIATTQYGASTQYGTRDSAYSYPQPATRQLPSDPQKWSKIFFLSPFPDRLAAGSELLYLSDGQIQYLKRLVMQIKYLRNWCIAQVAEDVIMVDSDDAILTWSDDSIWRA